MPLSESEQRQWNEIERALARQDPAFAAGSGLTGLRRRRRFLAVAMFAGGIAVLTGGVIVAQTAFALGMIITLLGFTLMVGTAAMVAGRWVDREP